MNKIVTFMLGAGIGSAATYFVVKRVIEERTDKEIESVVTTFRERFSKMEEILTDEQKEELGIFSPSKEMIESIQEETEEITDETEYTNEVEKLGYSVGVDLSEGNDEHAENIVNLNSAPYVITEDEFGEFGNEEETLIFYADNVLATEDDDPIDDIDSLVGNCLNMMGEYDETLYVRNQDRETDYVILRSEKNWSDITPEVNE